MRGKKYRYQVKTNKLYEDSGINVVRSSTFISVDIQPEYESYYPFKTWEFCEFLNENYDGMSSLIFLFNGPELGMISETEYMGWLMENGLNENVVDGAKFFDKGYAFFRYCMDEGIDEDDIIMLIQYMINNDINDSRDIDEEMWNDFMQEYNLDESDIRDLLEHADDMIHIPDLMEFLERNTGQGNIVLTGGGINECLKEVEIALMALNKPYRLYTKYTY